MLDATRAPESSASAVASSRDKVSSPPVSTIDAPSSGLGPSSASTSSANRTPPERSLSKSARFSSSSNHATMLAAISGPMPGTPSIWSSLAAAMASIDPNAFESTCATCDPTCRMFRPTSSRQIGRSFDASIALRRFEIDFSLNPGSSASCSSVTKKMSPGSEMNLRSSRAITVM